MITAGDFRNGVTFEMDGQVMQVVEFQHVKPGKGSPKLPSTPPQNSRTPPLTARPWSICTTTATSITS